MSQVVQITGAVLVLIAFAAVQTERWNPKERRYLILNVLGSLALGAVAIMNRDFGFILLEVVWAAVAGWGLLRPAKE